MADTPERPNESVDEYFDRLDAAFATLNDNPAFATLKEPPPAPPPEASSEAPAPAPNLIAEAFAALLALEEGEPGARPVRLTSAGGEPQITDALMDDLTRRIVERLAPDVVRAVVVEVVSEVAERLVREEIDRIRKKHHA
jgi:hypothetical protein